jgi:hypothetical protein
MLRGYTTGTDFAQRVANARPALTAWRDGNGNGLNIGDVSIFFSSLLLDFLTLPGRLIIVHVLTSETCPCAGHRLRVGRGPRQQEGQERAPRANVHS